MTEKAAHVYAVKDHVSLTLDELLDQADLTHKEYREWLAKHDHPLYTITPDMYEEMADYLYDYPNITAIQACKKYHIAPTYYYQASSMPIKSSAAIDSDESFILADAREGVLSNVQIAEKYGKTVAQIHYLVNTKHKITKNTRLTPEQKHSLILKKENGASVESLMKEFNIARPTVFNIIRKGVS